MAPVFYRSPGQGYPMAVRGQGVFLYDGDGREYLDGSGGAAVSCLGHAHPAITAAIKAQLDAMAFAHTAFFTNEPQERLAESIARRFPERGAHVYFLSGGSEANEAAIKMAREYWRSRGQDGKHVVISRRQSYHGNTLGALSVTGHMKRRAPYEPLLHDWPRIEPCYAYRHQVPGESDTDYARRAADALETAILKSGPERVSAFIAETVVGASLGAVPPAPDYLQRVREICDRHDVLLILDEVMAGGGRTGTWFAFEQDGVIADIVTVAKGLGGGYQPLGAAVARARVHDSLAEFGGFPHGHTYVGHATACAAGLAVLDTVEREGLLAAVRNLGEAFDTLLHGHFGDHPNVGDIRGRGLFRGIELVLDRTDKTPVPAAADLPMRLRAAAMEAGLICYPGGGTADGVDGAHVLLAPPFIITPEQLDELCRRLNQALDQVLQ